MRHKSDFPALSESVSAINKIANSETESIDKLSNTILKDFALTNKLLRLVNSAYFRPAGGGISTVSRAVIVLGFEAVRNIAITVLLFEHCRTRAMPISSRKISCVPTWPVCWPRILARRRRCATWNFPSSALFHSLGRLLSQFYFPEESDEIRRVIAQKSCNEDVAARQVLGISFEEMGMAIARQWGFPSLIVSSMRRLPPVRSGSRRSRKIACACCPVFQRVVRRDRPGDARGAERELKKTMARFAESVAIGQKELQQTVQRAVEEVADFARVIHLNLQQTSFGKQMRLFAKGGADGTLGGRVGPGPTATMARCWARATRWLAPGANPARDCRCPGRADGGHSGHQQYPDRRFQAQRHPAHHPRDDVPGHGLQARRAVHS
jgi:hypothetical protein